MSITLQQFQAEMRERVNKKLALGLNSFAITEGQLCEALSYSLLGGGKRIRPLLVYAAAQAVSEINSDCDLAASAVEMIHAYSLIHDDLPAMDDDDLRRGKPTCHKAFNEATAILAGDALQALAFEQLTQLQHTDPNTALTMINLLAKAAGAAGMVGGQAIDLMSVNKQLSLPELETMHRYKTGAMIEVSVVLGALCAGATQAQQDALIRYSQAIGLAFQVQDDILDVESSTTTLGKRQGADIALNKPTYTSLLGLEQAKQKASELLQISIDTLEIFDGKAKQLQAIAHYIVSRSF
jgi:geranylgeranyl diphosphate synthase type II